MFTVEEGRPWHDKIPGLHCKNLFLRDRKGAIWLVVMPADKRADLGRLEKLLSAPRFSFARSELLQEVLELAPGSVTPFGLINDRQRRVIDPALIILNHAAYCMDFWRKKLRTRAGDFDSRCM